MADAFSLMGHDLFGDEIKQKVGPLGERFTIPPFTVLSAREGIWQDRKRKWAKLGIQGELGRTATSNPTIDWKKWAASKDNGTKTGLNYTTGTSIFDPVLCELAYKWFCPPGGQIVDPFAGGSVRGIVAGLMGYKYYGIDLSTKQLEANAEQKEVIAPDADILWHNGDSLELMPDAPRADFIFTCPPYGNLEQYSDDPVDLSSMEYPKFLKAYEGIIAECEKRLKPGHMACFVVGDFRDKKSGSYYGFVADTINAFRKAGMELYNDAILVTAIGSLPIRVSAQFDKSRKMGKTHQNILVFRKPGDMPKF